MRVYLPTPALLLVLLLFGVEAFAAGPQPTPKEQVKNKPSYCLDAARIAVEKGDDVGVMEPYIQAALRGDVKAQRRIGSLYSNGEGIQQNDGEAFCWYITAAINGDALSQTLIGEKYETGNGAPQLITEALKWYHRAAAQGYDLAQHYLGVLYDKGNGVPQNYVTAAGWYKKAADQGWHQAQTRLGCYYMLGRGVRQDFVFGYMWFILSATDGDPEAMQMRDQTSALLTPAQIAKAQNLASQWKPKRSAVN